MYTPLQYSVHQFRTAVLVSFLNFAPGNRMIYIGTGAGFVYNKSRDQLSPEVVKKFASPACHFLTAKACLNIILTKRLTPVYTHTGTHTHRHIHIGNILFSVTVFRGMIFAVDWALLISRNSQRPPD